jgi:hypothetical protein
VKYQFQSHLWEHNEVSMVPVTIDWEYLPVNNDGDKDDEMIMLKMMILLIMIILIMTMMIMMTPIVIMIIRKI